MSSSARSNLYSLLFRLLRTQRIWTRALFVWVLGIGILMVDREDGFDLRFQMRYPQPHSSILLVTVSESELLTVQGENRNVIRPLKEINNLADSLFWNSSFWSKFLSQILSVNPRSVAVSFFFGEALSSGIRNVYPFNDPRVIWSASLDHDGRIIAPKAAREDFGNVGLNDIRLDSDGIARRFFSSSPSASNPFAHLVHRLAEKPSSPSNSSFLINFRGPARTFETVSLSDLLRSKVSLESLRNRRIIIGSEGGPNHMVRTPVGIMTRSEFLANAADQMITDRYIKRLNTIVCILALGLLSAFTAWIMLTYPHTVAFVFLLWTATAIATLSIWLFDAYQVWIPVLSPMVQIGASFMIFLSYQLTIKENLTWRLEQERKYLFEVEQLKNNFMSLISHDLKTPIAKIQAIIDRILSQNPRIEVKEDLRLLRNESAELHRYIQSILQLLHVEARDLKIHKEATDLNDLIERVVDQLAPLASAKAIRMEKALEPIFSLEIDPTLLREVLLNLVENAIKYTGNEGRVRVSSQEIDNQVIVTVEDSGVGIASSDIDHIWDKFYRTSQSAHVTKGSGLGLYLVRYFIELHEGEVFVESQVGRGTKIGFRLPILEAKPKIREESFPPRISADTEEKGERVASINC